MEHIFIEDGNGYYVNTVTVMHTASKRTYPPFTCHCKQEEIDSFKAVVEN